MEHAMDIRDVKITKLEADNMILQVIISYTYHILIETFMTEFHQSWIKKIHEALN